MDKVEEKISVEYGCKLIAEFMELKYRWVEYPNPQMNRWEVDKDNYWCAMRYYSSWDWLHPAWEKFRDMRLSLIDEGFHDAYSRHCQAISTAIHAYPINVAFERLVKAIEWYNQNKNANTET